MSWRFKFAILLLGFLSLVGMPQHQGEAQQQPPRRGPFFQPPPPPNPPPSRIQQQQSQQQRQQPQQPGIRPEDILRLIPKFIPPDQFDESYEDEYPSRDDNRSRSRSRSRTPAARQQIVLTADRFWMLSREEQQQELRRALSSFTGALAKTNNGEGWRDYLGVEVLKRAFAADQTDWPAADARKELAKSAAAFEKVKATPEYRKIAGMPGFSELHVGVRESSREPLDRSQRHLEASRSALAASLDRMSRGGSNWKNFLQLEELSRVTRGARGLDPQPEQPGIRLDPQPEQPGRQMPLSSLTPADVDQLKKIESRFQQVQGDPQYAAIARAPGFQQTRERLSALVAMASGEGVPEKASIAVDRPQAAPQAGSANPLALLDLSGDWSSNLGKVHFRQAGNRITGTLVFSNGVVAQITGTIQGDQLRFAWAINPQVRGDGLLTVSPGGSEMTGQYKDFSIDKTGPFNLTRDGAGGKAQ